FLFSFVFLSVYPVELLMKSLKLCIFLFFTTCSYFLHRHSNHFFGNHALFLAGSHIKGMSPTRGIFAKGRATGVKIECFASACFIRCSIRGHFFFRERPHLISHDDAL
ncbi:hypothetical protein MX569_03820, partial [Anoxybacillus kestanbolensis]